MTIIIPEPRTCFVCGQTNEYPILISTNTFGGAPDLDFRPAEMMRSTIYVWVNQCPICGYCAPDISQGPEVARQLIQAEPYVKQLHDELYPDLANKFLCSTLIQGAAGQFGEAGLSCLHAAWDCDDRSQPDAATICRLRAIDYFEGARQLGQSFGKTSRAENALLIDLFRRTEQFQRAIQLCEHELEKRLEPNFERAFRLQIELAARGDTAAHRAPVIPKSAAPPKTPKQRVIGLFSLSTYFLYFLGAVLLYVLLIAACVFAASPVIDVSSLSSGYQPTFLPSLLILFIIIRVIATRSRDG